MEKMNFKLMDEIMARLNNKHHFTKTNTDERQEVTNIMVSYGIVAHKKTVHGSEYSRGPNYKQAMIMGPKKYLQSVNKEVNPSFLVEKWEYLSNNSLISGLIGGVIGGVLVHLVIYYFIT